MEKFQNIKWVFVGTVEKSITSGQPDLWTFYLTSTESMWKSKKNGEIKNHETFNQRKPK